MNSNDFTRDLDKVNSDIRSIRSSIHERDRLIDANMSPKRVESEIRQRLGELAIKIDLISQNNDQRGNLT
jgi:SMC interacting uncharacterized protein involved in chromosome segregation